MKKSNKRKVGIDMKVIALIIACVSGFSFCLVYESTYTRNAVVAQIDNGLVSADDESGNTWTFWGDDFYIGQEVTLVMDDNHTTSNIYDDFVKKVLTR